jgi:hypothetical protein
MGVAASDRSPWGRAPAASTPAATTVRTAVSRVRMRGL